VSGPVEGHEQPMPSFKPDMIDNLAQTIARSLVVMIGGNFRMEVGKGLVYPHQTLLDDVQIDASAVAVVKVDKMHENSKNMNLEVPLDDTTLTLRDAITRRVQWRRTYIDVDPSATTSASTTSKLNTVPTLIFQETCPFLSPI
jgi:hypothetical protein